MEAEIIKEFIRPIRKKMTSYGIRKLHLDLQDKFRENNIKMGRDKFFRFAKEHRLLVRRRKNCFITTNSRHKFPKAKNLIKDLVPNHAEQVFVSDITYIKLQDKTAYLALVTDLYTKKIMGCKLDDNMRATLVKDALSMALSNCIHNRTSIIHHSDRGVQYCCPKFTEYALNNRMVLSTTEKSDPYENAVAERINGIMKYEFGFIRTIPTLEIANKMLNEGVGVYNNQRRHCSLQMQTPNFAHKHQKHLYKSYKKIKQANEQQALNSEQKNNECSTALSINGERKSSKN